MPGLEQESQLTSHLILWIYNSKSHDCNPIMTCKLNGLFDVGEDFDDEDLLEADWSAPSMSGPAPCPVLRGTTAPPNDQTITWQLSTPALPSHRSVQNVPGRETSTQNTVGQTVASGLRRLSTSGPQRSSSHLAPNRGQSGDPHMSSAQPGQQNHRNAGEKREAPLTQDDFDDWDIDLADLDECDPQAGSEAQVREMFTAPAPRSATLRDEAVSPAKRLRPSGCGGAQTVSSVGLRGFNNSNQSGLPNSNLPLRPSTPIPFPSPGPCPAFVSAPPQSPGVFPGLAAPPASTRPLSCPVTPRPPGPSHLQRPWASPGPHGRGPFDPLSLAASSSARSGGPTPPPCLAPRSSLHTPVLTNHLVQLVSASNRTPRRPRSDPTAPRTRRFPGPAGLLPRQPHSQSLDDIVVAIPQTPAHGAVARLPSQVPSSQPEEEDFGRGPWAAMKAEMGLDERNPSCFLHSYSVVMVLRKAALKQLAKNKVPNMAVVLKSILHTHADAKAVFRDHTGEMQGTVHRRLLEDRLGDLKTGAVLLLKQVGVFSPSHRNHYLNVTPNNLLRIYPPGGAAPAASQPLPPPHLEPLVTWPQESSSLPGGPVSQMELHFDDDDDEEEGQSPDVPAVSKTVTSMASQGSAKAAPPQDQAWDADDDLDELLVELPVESYSL